MILEIVTGIRAVERFVAQREVRDDIALDHSFQQRPLEPGRVAQMATREAATFESQPHQHVATKRFRYSKTFAHLTSRLDRGPDRACRQTPQDLIYQPEALLDLANAHPDASVDITGIEHGNFEIELIVGWPPAPNCRTSSLRRTPVVAVRSCREAVLS